MSELTITHNGVAQTAKAGSNLKKGVIKRITPTVLAGNTAVDDTVFATIEIPNAVREKGGVSVIHAITLLSYDGEGHDLSLIFMGENLSLGNAGDAFDIGSKSNSKSGKILGAVKIDWTDAQVNAKSSATDTLIFTTSGFTGVGADRNMFPLMIQAEPDSTSIFMTGIAVEAFDFAAVDDLEILLHIEYLD
mgnify:CR=1 FL=1